MKKLLFLLLISASLTIKATTYYVAPNGSDNNPGTITQPWASLQKGFSSIVAGDILYIRGGTYTRMADAGHGVSISGRDGRSGNIITVSAYPGETPVLDCSSLSTSSGVNYGILMSGCDYWLIKGLTVKNVREYNNLHKSSGGSPTAGWELSNCTNVTLELCTVTVCGNGFTLNGTLYDINYINCDAYMNYDYYDNGGLANGFNGHIEKSSTVYYTGCRAWSNSDDGFDNYAGAGYMVYKNCWAYRNGKDTPTIGNGDGFKLGFDHTPVELPNDQRTLYNCIAADNRLMGYDEGMDQPTGMDMALFNCIAYKNSNDYGFRFSRSWGTAITTLRNNIAYGNKVNYEGRLRNISDHNTWNSGAPALTDADFVSTDMSQLKRARKGDGSLPDIDFTRLKSGSRLIDAGIDIGLPYSGTAPDMGPFEAGTAVTTPPPAKGPAPVYQSSEISNSDPSSLVIKYNLSLASVTPPTGSFEVKVNSAARSVSKLSVSGSSVSVTLSSPVVGGDVVTFSYTKPSTNPLQSADGSQVESITGKSVVNSVAAGAPVYLGATVENDSPDKVMMSYDTKLANIVPPASSFTTTVNGAKQAIVAVSVSENTVTLSLSENLDRNDSITVTYIQPDKNPLQTTKGGIALTLTEAPVRNEILGDSTGTEEINGGKILIFPNPACDFIKVVNLAPDDKIPLLRLFDITGKLCQEIKLEDVTRMRKIPIDLKSGFYVAQILSGKDVKYVQKIVVVK